MDQGLEIQLPLPEGGFGRFHVLESPIMEPALAAKYPEIKTYVIQGIDDPVATGRIDMTYRGLRASVQGSRGRFFIDPYWTDNDSVSISYYTKDFSDLVKLKSLNCGVVGSDSSSITLQARTATAQRPTGASLRTYRLALAATGEYSAAVATAPVTKAKVLAAMVTSINRVSAVYEREFAIRLTLVANTDQLIYLDGTTDPYTNDDGVAMLAQNQTNVDAVIGSANYDIGHVFSTGGGGIAGLGVVCLNGQKANGVTGSPSPVGDAYDIDYVAHEMGHQFGGNHTFNGTTGSAAGNANITTAFEPGSGSTIMAYAGICSPQDLQMHSDDYFQSINYSEIDTYTTNSPGNGSTSTNFTAPISTGNSPPVIAALPSLYTIPSQTPFALTASATDANGDALTYCWEEMDHGSAPRDPILSPRDNGTCPLFRSYSPTVSPTRLFPSLTYILKNANLPPANYSLSGATLVTGEYLPTTSRTMNFRVSVRDNRAGGGGQNYATTQVASVSTAGPFKITSPNTATTIAAGSSQTVAWNVANTTATPISCPNVKISYSTDGGNTFPIVLASSAANTGTASVTIPNVSTNATTTGRFKVEAVGNIFFDINDANFIVTASTSAPTVTSFTPTSGVQQTSVVITGTDFSTATAVLFNGVNASSYTINSNTQISARVPATGSTGPISVSNSIGTGSSSSAFTFIAGPAAPTVTGFSPNNGIAGTSVVITGTDFSNVTLVSFNGANASYTVNSATQITAVVPSGATTGPLAVATSSGTAASDSSYIVLSGNGIPVVSSSTTASGTINSPLTSYQIAASNLPTTFSASNLPSGLSVNSAGLISGTPTVSGTILSTISASNSYGTGSATLTFTIAPASSATTVFSEDFAALTTGDNTTTTGSNSAWSGNSNFPTVSKAYQAGGAVKLGTSLSVGSITSKALDLSSNGGAFSVKFDVKGWTTVEGNIKVTVGNLAPQTVIYSATASGSFETKTLNFTGGASNSTLKIETTAKRAYIDNVSIIAGGTAGPALTLTGSGSGLTATSGSAGAPATLSVSGTNLAADITVNAPAGFEVSKVPGSSYGSTLTYPQTGGTVAISPLYVRIAAGASVGNVSGLLSESSSSALYQLALSGSVTAPTGPTFASTFPGFAATDNVGGVPALIAYALGGSSSASSNIAILPQAGASSGQVQITFLARTNDPSIAISVEGNIDLTTAWTAPVSKMSGVDQAGVPTGFERQTWSLTATGRGFLRVRVVQN